MMEAGSTVMTSNLRSKNVPGQQAVIQIQIQQKLVYQGRKNKKHQSFSQMLE
jgi:hypothetical protein